jgi:hypothetical protein
VHPDTGIGGRGLAVMDDFLSDVLQRIVARACEFPRKAGESDPPGSGLESDEWGNTPAEIARTHRLEPIGALSDLGRADIYIDPAIVDETAVLAGTIDEDVINGKCPDDVEPGPDAARLQAVVTLDSRDVQSTVRLGKVGASITLCVV